MMSILDKLKPKKPTIGISSAPLDLAQKAQLLIGELVKDLDTPNQNIINDLILLITTISRNPDPSINMTAVQQTAQILIHQLVKPIPNPNQQLIDELLHLITVTGSQSKTKTAPLPNSPASRPQPIPPPQRETTAQTNIQPGKTEQKIPGADATQTALPQSTAGSQPVENNASRQQTQVSTTPQPSPTINTPNATASIPTTAPAIISPTPPPTPAAPPTATQPSALAKEIQLEQALAAAKAKAEDKKTEEKQLSKHMLNLIMDQTKEAVKVTNVLNHKIKDLEDKTMNKMASHEDTINELKEKLETYEKNFEEIQKAMDKFIGLYEIITNQFNPFVHDNNKEDRAESDEIEKIPVLAKTEQVQSAPQTSIPQTPAAQSSASPAPSPTIPQTQPTEENITLDHQTDHSMLDNLPTTLGDMIKFLKETSDPEYTVLIAGDTNLLAAWAKNILRDPQTSTMLETRPPKQDAIKQLMKVMLREKVNKKANKS